jgi:hypothetical protein
VRHVRRELRLVFALQPYGDLMIVMVMVMMMVMVLEWYLNAVRIVSEWCVRMVSEWCQNAVRMVSTVLVALKWC